MRAKVFKKSKWLLSISANCLVTVTMSIIAWILLDIYKIEVLTLTGTVDSGLPAWQLPWEFNRNTTASFNLTEGSYNGPFELAEEFGLGLVMIPLVSMMQHLAITKHQAWTSLRYNITMIYWSRVYFEENFMCWCCTGLSGSLPSISLSEREVCI